MIQCLLHLAVTQQSLELARDDLTRLDNEIEELEVEIDVLTTKLQEQSTSIVAGDRAIFSAIKSGQQRIPAYVVDKGIVETSDGDLISNIMPPIDTNRKGGRAISGVMVLTRDAYLKYERFYSSSSDTQVDAYGDPANYALNNGRECNVYDYALESGNCGDVDTGQIEVKKAELKVLKEAT